MIRLQKNKYGELEKPKATISNERKKYLRKIKFRKIEILVTQISIIVIFIAIWEILANMGKIDSFITSQPSQMIC